MDTILYTYKKDFSNYFLDVINFDFKSGCLSQSEHPFTTGINSPYDVRITTNYDINDIRSSLFSVLHEGGHAIYEQNINPKLVGTRLNTGASMGIHESQSRFYENIIGRNLSFWKNTIIKFVRFYLLTLIFLLINFIKVLIV